MKIKEKEHKINNSLGYIYAWISVAMVVAVCLLIIFNVFYLSSDALSLDFLIKEPNASALNTEAGGILTPMIGTMLLTIIGICIALPFSLATAIYLVFYARKGLFKALIKSAIDILAGVPTVVIALFALAIFTQPIFGFLSTAIEGVEGSNKAYGKSFLVAGITMAMMILPFVIKAMEEALKSVPHSYVEGALALGSSKWHTIYKVVLPSASQGIVTGTILGMGRIIGDTAIVWLALGGTLRMTGLQPWWQPQNWMSTLKNTGSTLTSYIYYTSPAGEGNSYQVAFAASFVLIVIIILLNTITALLGNMGKAR